MNKHYGNNNYWCFIEEGWNEREISIWKNNTDGGEIIARAHDKYEAKLIIDALLNYVHIENKTVLGKKEIVFLEFARSNCTEPYATMAANAILWNDKEAYNKLKSDFSKIYE